MTSQNRMKQWKRIDDGLYQRFDDGVPQNVYIDRYTEQTESGRRKYIGWMWGEKINGNLDATGEHFRTLKEAKAHLMNVEGYKDE